LGYETTAVSTATFKVFVSEPVYDDSYDMDYAEQIMTDQVQELDISGSSNADAIGGYQSFQIEWIVSQEYNEDDIIVMTFNADFPSDIVDGSISQWVQFASDRDTSGDL